MTIECDSYDHVCGFASTVSDWVLARGGLVDLRAYRVAVYVTVDCSGLQIEIPKLPLSEGLLCLLEAFPSFDH